MTTNKVEFTSPFGPSIGRVKIPENLIVSLNNYVDEIIKDENKLNELNHGKKLAGNVKQEFRLENDFINKIGWDKFLGNGVANWINGITGKKITQFHLISSWIVRQFKNEYNPTHWHGGHVSGVGYIKVPKTLGPTTQKEKKTNLNGHLQLIHGSKMFLSNSTIDIKPEVGDFYFFPNYMMHTVFPFTDSDDERRSISFNAKIDENIYNVYGG